MSEPPPTSPWKLQNLAKRRQANVSDTTQGSSRAVSLEAAMQQSLRLEEKLDDEAKTPTPETTLQYMLSFKSVISTNSSNAERQQAAVETNEPLREIGTGSIGKVFEDPGTVWCYKLPLLDRSDKLWNNYVMHLKVHDAFDRAQAINISTVMVEIPRAQWFATETTADFWDENIDRFPFDAQFNRKCRQVLCMERIFPLPKPIRESLIEKYCVVSRREAARENPANKDCLIRPMLGRRKFGEGSRFGISLRNFKLHVEQIKDLGLDAQAYAEAMADAMAILHWVALVDAMDVEFVLGSAPTGRQAVRQPITWEDLKKLAPGTSTFEMVTKSAANFKKRIISLWLIDFDACQPIERTKEGAEQAAKAFMLTEAQCPRPATGNDYADELWKQFSKRYIWRAQYFLGTELHFLPILFIELVEKMAKDAKGKSANQSPSSSRPGSSSSFASRGRERGPSGEIQRPLSLSPGAGSWRRFGGSDQPQGSQQGPPQSPSFLREGTSSSPSRGRGHGRGRGRGQSPSDENQTSPDRRSGEETSRTPQAQIKKRRSGFFGGSWRRDGN